MERRSWRSFRGGFIIFFLLSGFKVSFPFPARPWHLFCHGDVQRGKRCKMWAVPWDGDGGVWGTSPLDLGRGCAGHGVPLGHGVVLPTAHGEEELNCPSSSPGKPSLWPQRAEHSGTVRMGRVWCQNISFGGFCAQSSLLPSKQHFALTRNRGTKGGANPMPTAPALRWSQEQLWVGLGKAFLGVFIKKT